MRIHANDVEAILCSDLHLSHKAPIARSAEPDWYAAMERPLAELRELADLLVVPVICAGDIFDRWNAPASLINFALDALPKMYAIPGQHDLANHSYRDIEQTAYWTLVKAGKVTNIRPDKPRTFNNLHLAGFPWGSELKPCEVLKDKRILRIAVVHHYVWWRDHKYPGAPKNTNWSALQIKLDGFQVAVFGDNHKGFHLMAENEGDPWMMNCGTMMRRKADEVSYQPQFGLLSRRGGIITPYLIDTSEDKFIDTDEALALIDKGVEMAEFISELGSLRDKGVSFVEAVAQFCQKNGIDSRIQKIISTSLKVGE